MRTSRDEPRDRPMPIRDLDLGAGFHGAKVPRQLIPELGDANALHGHI